MRFCEHCQGQLPDPTDPIKIRDWCSCEASSVDDDQEERTSPGALGVIGGSLPVSSAAIMDVVAMLERKAEKLYSAEQDTEDSQHIAALYYCADVLNRHSIYVRRQVEHQNERQPEENKTGDQFRGQSAP